ncbi:unannotated protein [freshwater metagenome]|uniref:Unannotated protein n=1 Tax=freshwater metagenome TaxID=449393 RepID=A0A6J7ARN8_9ZZZZ
MYGRVEEPSIHGHPADRKESPDAAVQHVGDRPQSAVPRDGDVEGLVTQRSAKAIVGEHVSVEMTQMCDFVDLVLARVQNGHGESTGFETVRYRRAGRSRSADKQHTLRGHGR